MSSAEFLRLIEKENLKLDCERLNKKTIIQNKIAEDFADEILVKLTLMGVISNDSINKDKVNEIYCSIVEILTKD